MINTPTPDNYLKQSKYTPISFYNKLTDKASTEISFERVFELIQSGEGFKTTIEKIRNEPEKAKRDEIKKSLPAVAISGMFGESRKVENLIHHSGFIQIDFDEVKNIEQSIEQLQKDKFTFAAFISPTGKGIKLIAKISPDKGTHINSFLQLESYYLEMYQLKADKQCKDVSRLLFLSWDEYLFVNENADTWELTKEASKSKFDIVLQNFEKRESFTEGERNVFVFKLGCECLKNGIDIDKAIVEIINRFSRKDFNSIEIATTVRSAYKLKSTKAESEAKYSNSISQLQRAEDYIQSKYDIRLNEVSGKIECKHIGESMPYTELNENNIWRELERNGSKLPIQTISILMGSDFVPKYNPFNDYFENLPKWDIEKGIDYIDKLCDYVPAKDKERFKIQFKKMLVRCVACAIDPHVFNKQVFVLVGEGQNTGKSTFCRWICPPALGNYITEHVNTDKDGLIILATNFIINMDELATLSKAELSTLKSFISKDKINVRLPYAKRTSVHPRRANFIGSTNSDEFLTDETGNVRWLCFEIIGKLNWDYKNETDINNIWMQAYTLYKSGFDYQLSPNEIRENELANSKYQIDSIEAQLIRKHYTPATKESGKFVSSSDIMDSLAIHHSHQRTNTRNIGKALKILGFVRECKYDTEKGYTEKGYYISENFNSTI